MNKKIISELFELQKYTEILNQTSRSQAYKKAIFELVKLKYPLTIKTIDAAFDEMKNIGPGIRSIIVEFITYNKIKELEYIRNSKEISRKISIIKSLKGIIGVGPVTVDKWIAMDINSLNDLQLRISAGDIKLNKMQEYGLKYYDDLNQRINRNEVYKLGNTIYKLILSVVTEVIFNISGSYRRGSSSSGDVDILISTNRYKPNLLSNIVIKLKSNDNFVCLLNEGVERIIFLFKSPFSGRVRQIDIINIKPSSYYAALLYFTGDFEFNTMMRSWAKKNGYRLNQNGLFKINKNKLTQIKTTSEKDIFDILKLVYIEPPYRDLYHVLPIEN